MAFVTALSDELLLLLGVLILLLLLFVFSERASFELADDRDDEIRVFLGARDLDNFSSRSW